MKYFLRKGRTMIISAVCLCIAFICAVIAFTVALKPAAAAEIETNNYGEVYQSSQDNSVAKNEVYIYGSNVTIRGGKGGQGGYYHAQTVRFDEYGNIAVGPGSGGMGDQPFGGTNQVTVYLSETSTNVVCEEGSRGERGRDKTLDPVDPINPIDPVDPIYPPYPPIYIN